MFPVVRRLGGCQNERRLVAPNPKLFDNGSKLSDAFELSLDLGKFLTFWACSNLLGDREKVLDLRVYRRGGISLGIRRRDGAVVVPGR